MSDTVKAWFSTTIKDLYIFVNLVFRTVSQVTIFYSSLDTVINTNTLTPRGGAPTQAEYTFKKERRTIRTDTSS